MIPVHVVGLGMSVADLPPKAMEIVRSAQVLVGGKRHLGYFPQHPAERVLLGADLKGAYARIRDLAASHQVVVLTSGDPNFYGVGPGLVEALGAENVVIHPNITTVQAAFARLKIPWHDAEVVSLHGRGWEALEAAIGRAAKIAVYTAADHGPKQIARFLAQRGLEDARVCVLEELEQDSERITWLRPREAEGRAFSDLNLVVILRDSSAPKAKAFHLGMPEDAYAHQEGLVTKVEGRAVALAKLALMPGQVLWDVGAGCGSVGLEASLLIPGGRVVAVEQDPQRAEQIRLNGARFGVKNLEVHCGQAPGCLDGLTHPDRVFIGGGSRRLEAILDKVFQRLRPPGRVVLTVALLETLERAKAALAEQGWDVEITQLQVSRGRKLGMGMHLKAMNPVWIVSGSGGVE
jgi:precorrin-6Y C5,15-methyltransferase (decarboxylating)